LSFMILGRIASSRTNAASEDSHAARLMQWMSLSALGEGG
jgi:hypothetical protein